MRDRALGLDWPRLDWFGRRLSHGAGLSADGVRLFARTFIEQNNPMKRPGTSEDMADAATYLASDLAESGSGQHLLLSGGAAA